MGNLLSQESTPEQRFKVLREHLKYSGQEFAEILGLKAASNVYAIEKGRVRLNDDVMKQLIERFHVNLNWLLTGEGMIFINDNPTPEPNQEGTKKEATLNPEKGGMYMLINKLEERYQWELELLKKENERLWVLIGNSNLGKDYAPNFTGVAFANKMIA